MTWHTTTVPSRDLLWLTGTIRALGGTVTGARPEADGVHVTWTTTTDVLAPSA